VGPAGAAVRQGSLREHNLALVLRHVAAPAGADDPTLVGATGGRAPSRADLATRTGLTRATVSALVDDLITGGLVREVDPAPRAGAGRPAAGLVLACDGPAGLGLEINVDYLAACVVDLTGALRHREVRRVDLRPVPAAEALARVADLAVSARREAARQGLPLAGTALAVPGLVTSAGVVRLAPNLGWHDVDIPAVLGHPDPAPLVDNEANLAALGELHAGSAGPDLPHAGSTARNPVPAGSAGRNFLYVSGEIGIGAGIVLDGALFRGARGWSGELGHVPVHPDGITCRCGGQGCLERYAGQEAILTAAGLTDPALPADQAITRLADLAGRGDPDATASLTTAGTALGVAVAGVINLLDIETIVLGGMYAPLARWLTPPVESEIRRRVLTAAWSPVTVRPAVLGGDAATLGAAGSVVRGVLEHPARWLGLGSPQ
jgi:predicted NBD/HSP70 family sugar kinase